MSNVKCCRDKYPLKRCPADEAKQETACQTLAEELRSYFAALLKPQLPYVIRRSEAETFIVKGFRLLGI